MIEKQSEFGRDAQLAILLRHKCQAEIERAVDKVKLGIVQGRKLTQTAQWFRRNWYRSMMRDRKKKGRSVSPEASRPATERRCL